MQVTLVVIVGDTHLFNRGIKTLFHDKCTVKEF